MRGVDQVARSQDLSSYPVPMNPAGLVPHPYLSTMQLAPNHPYQHHHAAHAKSNQVQSGASLSGLERVRVRVVVIGCLPSH